MGPNQPGRPIYSPDGTSGQEQSRGCRLEPGRIVSFRQRRKKNLKHLIGWAGCGPGNSLFELSVTVWKRPGSLRRFYPQKSHKKQAPGQEKSIQTALLHLNSQIGCWCRPGRKQGHSSRGPGGGGAAGRLSVDSATLINVI